MIKDPFLQRNAAKAPGGEFANTHWSVILAAAETSTPGADEALEELCRTYWRPVYAYVRRQGHNPDDARDLTQEFFAQFLERKRVKLADPVRGRFRSFLIALLKNFLTTEWRRGQAQKRGGGHWLIPLEEQQEAETHLSGEPADPATTPDRAFERRWAILLLDQVLARLRAEYAATGREDHFDALKVLVWGDSGTASQAEVAARLGISPNALGVTVHRLRRRFGELLREQLAQTVPSRAEIDDELRHLMDVLGS
jgi:RNA polymerase sigma-70 factor (ECF subfamily)